MVVGLIPGAVSARCLSVTAPTNQAAFHPPGRQVASNSELETSRLLLLTIGNVNIIGRTTADV